MGRRPQETKLPKRAEDFVNARFPRLQYALTEAAAKREHEALLGLLPLAEAAHLQSCSGPGATAFMAAFPTDDRQENDLCDVLAMHKRWVGGGLAVGWRWVGGVQVSVGRLEFFLW